jgi:hypothetical protein
MHGALRGTLLQRRQLRGLVTLAIHVHMYICIFLVPVISMTCHLKSQKLSVTAGNRGHPGSLAMTFETTNERTNHMQVTSMLGDSNGQEAAQATPLWPMRCRWLARKEGRHATSLSAPKASPIISICTFQNTITTRHKADYGTWPPTPQ